MKTLSKCYVIANVALLQISIDYIHGLCQLIARLGPISLLKVENLVIISSDSI